jgi:hypothetical protein
VARFSDGRAFADIGDATPALVVKPLRHAYIRVAGTRAAARALRRALNIAAVAVQELVEEDVT